MIIFRTAAPVTEFIFRKKINGLQTGFVPTMGALHQGHLSLIDEAKTENDLVVCSIFINPSQFNNSDDFAKYPVTIEKDIEMLEKAGCDILFLPAVLEIYPPQYIIKQYNLGALENVLEGKHRPGHFQGVCQVVDRLLEIVNPDNLYLGQKDYQQCLVIKKLMELTDRKIITHVIATKRETSGLAMSSRNLRLDAAQKSKAAIINKMLNYIKQNINAADILQHVTHVKTKLEETGFDVDYVSIADAETLQPATTTTTQPMVALIAATLNGVRLIDNTVLNNPA